MYICRISPTSGKYQKYNPAITEVNKKLEGCGHDILDLELYDTLLFDGLHPRYPQGIHQMVTKVLATLRRVGVAVSQHFEMTKPRFMQQYNTYAQRTQANLSHPPSQPHLDQRYSLQQQRFLNHDHRFTPMPNGYQAPYHNSFRHHQP